MATCIEHSCVSDSKSDIIWDGAPSFMFPSHPPIARPSRTVGDLRTDPKGLTYEPVWEGFNDFQEEVQPLFPDLAAWKCYVGPLQAPATLKLTALYLTATSTATESGDVPSDSPTYTATILPINENRASQAPTQTSGPPASKPEKAATTLPETIPGSVPKLTATTQAPSAIGGLSSKQVPSSQAADAATASSSIANVHAPASAVEAMSPTKVLASEQVPSQQSATVSSPSIAPSENVGQPAVILTSTNPQGSLIATTSPVIGSALRNEAAPIVLSSHTILTDAKAQYSQPLLGSGTSTLPAVPTLAAAQVVSVGTQVLATNSEDQYVIGTQTLAHGVPVTLGSGDAATAVVLHTFSTQDILIVGPSTMTLPKGLTALVPAAPAALTIGSQILAANSEGQCAAGSQTLAPGSPITLASGSAATPVLLQTTSSNTVLIVGSSTTTLIGAATAAPQPLTIGPYVVSVNSRNQYIVGSQTLAPGSPITLGSDAAATPVSLQTSGSQTFLIAGSTTSTLAAVATALQPITIGSQVVTANAEDQYVVGSQTLTPGGAITVSGTPVSLAPSGAQVVVGTSTEGVGNYILSGLGMGPSGRASSTLSFTGAAGRQFQSMWKLAICGIGAAALMLWL